MKSMDEGLTSWRTTYAKEISIPLELLAYKQNLLERAAVSDSLEIIK